MLDYIPEDIRQYIIPRPGGKLSYRCLGCGSGYPVEKLHYVCPKCSSVLLINDEKEESLKKIPGATWRKIFDFRKLLKIPALKGIYRFHEFLGRSIPLESIVYLGEGHTPVIEANDRLKEIAGLGFYFKNDGQNPSASFKDRGMASALSSIKYLMDKGIFKEVVAVCASTGDTSAAAALYASYLDARVRSAVLLPHGKVTSQQLAQPLGSGASVFEIPGVFDDCMKVVEYLSEMYPVALLNSKNAWRILGQESFSYEIAQDFDWDMENKAVVVPIGNAGNISAVMNGFIKFFRAGIIECLPKVIGVQSEQADPVYQYYTEPDEAKRCFKPMAPRPSVAQAAMIGNPVSMPRVVEIAGLYDRLSSRQNVFFVQVREQDIMDCQLMANGNGHIACTQGGEALAGLVKAAGLKIVDPRETAILDSTAHAIKFSEFQDLYFNSSIPGEYKIVSDTEKINMPSLLLPDNPDIVPSQEKRLKEEELKEFVRDISGKIAANLSL